MIQEQFTARRTRSNTNHKSTHVGRTLLNLDINDEVIETQQHLNDAKKGEMNGRDEFNSIEAINKRKEELVFVC